MPVFAALGAICTVLDYSPLQLESERMVAEREGYGIRIIRGDMTKRLPFEDGEFDIIFHPVSNCYVEVSIRCLTLTRGSSLRRRTPACSSPIRLKSRSEDSSRRDSD